jgi:hypothetical protein
MQGRDLFGVLIRAGGVTLLIFAAFDLFHLFAKLLDIALPSTVSASADAIAMVWYLVLGLILLLRADWIVAGAYRE